VAEILEKGKKNMGSSSELVVPLLSR